ncbi:zinc uptake transcriptional repressor Zur [Aeromonas schubertii]|uniref:Ferric uptake regulation protein n=1 Tax=Aeromonas schubertii TaxID=652 RepID=A0ABS7V9E6_9GAMM|nr:zinc uptake transcriptional repressor Zur [Aeromonas schubertii]KUE78730.1 XRE family transcriptional regulator [Aeromonas schubertii]MBZ6065692.1 zinc uptake transcriptional repressor Zur [Aeromonas schubertii]QCG46992.1 zinc uptake transcriptional repressor Zur [Aeromonas schubertii]
MDLEQLLSRARRLCEQRGLRFTATRQQVLCLLARHGNAISAYDLLDQLRLTEPNAKPPTIYRALDFLLEQGFAHKVESLNAYIYCCHFDHAHPMQLLICDRCGNVVELHDSTIDSAFLEQARQHGFTITNKTIEAHGQCARCA